MPPRKGSKKTRKPKNKSLKKQQSRPRTSERVVYVPVIYRRSRPKSPPRRPHHYSYHRHGHSDYHEHVNRVNYSSNTSDLSQQDLIQRQLKASADSYVPNFMHVSSNELAIPPPYLKMNGMRMFARA